MYTFVKVLMEFLKISFHSLPATCLHVITGSPVSKYIDSLVKCWLKEVLSNDNILLKSEELIVLRDCLLTHKPVSQVRTLKLVRYTIGGGGPSTPSLTASSQKNRDFSAVS
jgi:hypothetical protein